LLAQRRDLPLQRACAEDLIGLVVTRAGESGAHHHRERMETSGSLVTQARIS
jgi:hypothetical protein